MRSLRGTSWSSTPLRRNFSGSVLSFSRLSASRASVRLLRLPRGRPPPGCLPPPPPPRPTPVDGVGIATFREGCLSLRVPQTKDLHPSSLDAKIHSGRE